MLSDIGTVIENELLQIPVRYDGVRIDAYTIMPNHLHCIIVIEKPEPFGKYPTLSEIVGLYKSGVTKQLHLSKPKMIIWQKSFYHLILRDNAAYLGVLRYIEENPRKWESDEYYG